MAISKTGKLKEEKKFPKFMRINDDTSESKGTIVLFFQRHVGIVVNSTGGHPVGYFTRSWYMSSFVDYNDPVNISMQND